MAGQTPVARRTRLQETIATIWKDVLGIGDVELDADFFELGGESLSAVHMLAAVDEALEVGVDFTDFLDGPTIGELAVVVERAVAERADGAPDAPELAASAGPVPVSFAQERLWFLEQLGGSSEAYNMPIGARVRGPLDAGALDRALVEIVRRHDALRTTFASEDGHAVQVVGTDAVSPLEQIDLCDHPDAEAEAQRLVDDLASAPLDLAHGPLVRALLLRVAEDEHIIELVFHHIVCDGWSQVVIFRELAALYGAYSRGAAPDLPAPRVQYPDFARAERARMQGPALEDAVAPWLERLAGAPEALELPTDRPRPQVPSDRGATYRHRLPTETAAALRSYARAARATPFATLLAIYYLLLARHSGQDDIVVGVTTSGRDRTDLEDGVGLFASTVALRGDLSGAPSFDELVARVREVVLWAIAHEQAPFEQIVARMERAPDLSRHPVFQVFCAHVPLAPLAIEGAEPYDARPSTSRFDLCLFVEEEPGEELELAWEYSTDLFDAGTVDRFARRYMSLLEAALADPGVHVAELPMLDAAEQDENAAAAPPPAPDAYPVACMHELFERHAAATPDAVALTFEGASLSYGELNRRANRLAHRLGQLGAGRETLVALFLEPSFEMVVSILGVLKAGAAYVPLDPEYPAERIAFVLEDTDAPLLLTTEALVDRVPASSAHVVCLDDDMASLSPENPEPLATPENLAYVIYTSGSTGRPKGVQVEHRNVARLLTATDHWYGFGPADVWVLLHSYAFDFSVWELWGALAYGGRLAISPLWTTRSPSGLAELVAEQGVTVLNMTPSLFVTVQDELLRASDELSLRYVIFGGEALAPPALRPWYERHGDAGATLVNMYGITETTVHVTYRPLTAADCERDTSPIGVPIPDLSLHLLDPGGAPVPVGVAGELFVGGAGVARGYLNRPELTAERFIENPFGPGRLYRTGDVARRLADGELDFAGRIDDQVKIRGFRIELGEVAAAIREVSGVSDTAVVAVDAAPGDTRLVAYLVPDAAGAAARDAALRDAAWAHLEEKLPAYMVPASIMVIDRLPLTRNGKTDRKALPPPVWEKQAAEESRAPQTPTEELIAEIWKGVLGVESVGADDNFFNLGGHSLLAARVITQARQRCEVALSVRALFEHPTLSAFAAQVDAAAPAASAKPAAPPAAPPEPAPAPETPATETPAPETPAAQSYPLSFPQQQLLLFDSLDPGSVTYNAALAIRVRGELDVGLLRGALERVFERHEALRTVLIWDDATPRQVVLESWNVELPVVEVADDDGLEQLMREHALRPFDLAGELMLRTTLFRLAPDEHVLLFQPHHVAFDAWAVEIFYRELGELYDAAREGRDARLPELRAQYHDFAVHQRERLRGDLLDHHLDFWRSQLAGAPTVLRLPTDHRRPPMQTFEGATLDVRLDAALADEIRGLCQSAGVTPYMLLLAAFATLLYRRSGQDDVLFGGPMANRDEAFEDLIGFFANTIVVRVRLGGNPEFAELLRGVRDSVLGSYEHQEVPLELVVQAVGPDRDPGVNPLFQVNFRVRVGAPPVLALSGTETSSVPVDMGLARFDLALELHVLDGGITAEFNYNTALFERATIERLSADFESLLRQAVADPASRLLGFELSEDGEPAATDGRPGPGPGAGIRGFRRLSAR